MRNAQFLMLVNISREYILLYRFLNDFDPKWSGKAPNEIIIIMGGKYSQTSYGDFWNDSRNNVF